MEVFFFKRIPLFRIVAVPFTKLIGRRDLLGPVIDFGFVLGYAPRPHPIHKDSAAVRGIGSLIRPLEPNIRFHGVPPRRTHSLFARFRKGVLPSETLFQPFFQNPDSPGSRWPAKSGSAKGADPGQSLPHKAFAKRLPADSEASPGIPFHRVQCWWAQCPRPGYCPFPGSA